MSKNKIFEANPSLDCYYATSDGQAFYTQTDALAHAKTLKDKSVEAVYNLKTLEVVEPQELTPDELAMADFEATEEEKTELAKALANFDPETAKYPEALKLFKALGLEAENEKKETIYPLIVAAKAKAQEGVNTQV